MFNYEISILTDLSTLEAKQFVEEDSFLFSSTCFNMSFAMWETHEVKTNSIKQKRCWKEINYRLFLDIGFKGVKSYIVLVAYKSSYTEINKKFNIYESEKFKHR